MRSSLMGSFVLGLLVAAGVCSQQPAARSQTTINQTFTYTNASQFFVVPIGVSSLFARLWGSGGANGDFNVAGGGGAFVSGNLSVTPGQKLTLIVGGGLASGGGGAQNGGGVGGVNGGVNGAAF